MTTITKAQYRSRNGRIVFELQGGSVKDTFECIAEIQEIFEADETCGCCNSSHICFNVRDTPKGSYYELRCQDCGAQMGFGQKKDMKGLFPKRTEHPDHRGWYVYTQPQNANSSPGQDDWDWPKYR